MLTLNADSACDVCAEEYGPFNLPRCIPCGHVLCATCADTIIDKASTSPALLSSRALPQQQQQQPLCPFCRDSFTREGVRVIRIDFSGSSGGGVASSSGTGLNGGRGMGDTETCIDGGALGPSLGMSMSGTLDDEMVLYDPRSRSPPSSSRTSRDPSRATSPERTTGPTNNGIFHTINEDHSASPLPLPANFDVNAHRERARELEKKVAKVACKRCSAEEVQALQRELGDWLSVDKILGSNGVAALDKQQHAAIHLSHLLIRAILMNHLAHSEASRVAKGAEAQLRARIADGELVREKLDADLRKAKKELAARMQENMALRAELASRLNKGAGSNNEDPSAHGYGEFRAVTPTRRQSLSAPTSPDGYFPSFAFSSTSSASTAVPPPSASRSNPASGTNSPCSSGRTTPTAGLALGGGGMGMMPMGSQMSIGMTLSSAGISPSPSMNGAGERAFMSTSGGMSSASASAAAANSTSTSSASAAAAAGHRTFSISAPPPRAQSTAPSSKGISSASSATTTPTRPQSTVPPRSQTPASPTRYGGGHARSASMIHRSATVVPGLSSSSASASASAASHAHSHSHSTSTTTGRDRRSMTPAPPSLPHPGTGGPGPGPASSSPMHQRSASVAPGALSSASSAAAGRGVGLARSMTPNLRSSNTNTNTKDRDGREKEGMGMGNGYSAGGTNTNTNGYGFSSASGFGQGQGHGGIPPVPALPSLSSLGVPSSRPPVPPKPRTLSQSPSSQTRGVIDDRDGYATEREREGTGTGASKKDLKDVGNGAGKKERSLRHMHERWLPSALVDRMTRPATSQG